MTRLWRVIRCRSGQVAGGEAAVWAGTGGAASATRIVDIVGSGSSAIPDHVVERHVQFVGHFERKEKCVVRAFEF